MSDVPVTEWIFDSLGAPTRYGRSYVVNKLSVAERDQLHVDCVNAGQITYIPSVASTGLLPGIDPTDLTPVGDGTTEVAAVWGTTQRTNQIIWGQLNPSTSSQSSLYNCWVAGPRPDLVDANPNSTGMIREVSNSARVWKAQHTVFNPWAWTMPELNPPGGAWSVEDFLYLAKNSIGIRGGRFQLDNCEVTGTQDPFNIFSTLTSSTTDELITNSAYMRHCWLHAALYYRGPLYPSQPEGTHSDLFQWSRPQYFTQEYNMFGGPDGDLSGYALTPSKETSDGAHNSGNMAQQENPGGALGYVQHVTVRRNIYWQHTGAESNGYNINHYYNQSYPNNMATVDFTDNLHVRRSDGKYVIVSSAYHDLHVGHRIIDMNEGGTSWTDGGAVTLTGGG
jgi:hypothetical protein